MQISSQIQLHCSVFSMIYFDFFKVLLLLQQRLDYHAGAEINFKSIWRQTPQLGRKVEARANLIFLFEIFTYFRKIYNFGIKVFEISHTSEN